MVSCAENTAHVIGAIYSWSLSSLHRTTITDKFVFSTSAQHQPLKKIDPFPNARPHTVSTMQSMNGHHAIMPLTTHELYNAVNNCSAGAAVMIGFAQRICPKKNLYSDTLNTRSAMYSTLCTTDTNDISRVRKRPRHLFRHEKQLA